MPRRSRRDIIEDMLAALQDNGGSLKPTHLLYKANLSHPQMKGYLEDLSEKEFLLEREEDGHIEITNLGRRYLEKIEEIKAFEEGFGL